MIRSAGASEGVRVLPGCEDQRRSYVHTATGLIRYHHPEAVSHTDNTLLNTELGLLSGLLIMSNLHLIYEASTKSSEASIFRHI